MQYEENTQCELSCKRELRFFYNLDRISSTKYDHLLTQITLVSLQIVPTKLDPAENRIYQYDGVYRAAECSL